MKIARAAAGLFAIVVCACSANNPPDLTGAGPSLFRAHLGKVVAIRGRLEVGVQGDVLVGGTPSDVVFYVIPDMPASGGYTDPESWARLYHKQVRLTGELKYQSFPDSTEQHPPDYYYMVTQRTKIEALESK